MAVDFLPGRVVRWTFDDILLVDSITNEPLSHGLTSFRIRLHEPVLPGITVTNAADIFWPHRAGASACTRPRHARLARWPLAATW